MKNREMRKRRSLEEEINDFWETWGGRELIQLLRDVIPLFQLYDVQDERDWVEEEVGKENEREVRLLRTIYLVSKLSDRHAGKLCLLNTKFKGLWIKMEQKTKEIESGVV